MGDGEARDGVESKGGELDCEQRHDESAATETNDERKSRFSESRLVESIVLLSTLSASPIASSSPTSSL